jgi:hypothetical protein
MNSKVKVNQTRRDYACIVNKRGTQLAQSQSIPGRPLLAVNKRGTQLDQSQSVPGRPLLAPIYRWPGLKDPVGFNTNYSVRIRYHLIFRL